MSRHRNQARWRDALPGRRLESDFRWRSHEVSRIEGFSDTVFAFAVTLLIVALEVPHDYAGLVAVIRGFPAFVVSFVILMFFWSVHYRFFRRYGLKDVTTEILNYAILLMVLFAAYPLKFVFSALFDGLLGNHAHAPSIDTLDQLHFVFRAYGSGLALTWGLFGLLYWHAYRMRDELRLNPVELLRTRADLCGFALCVGVCLLSIVMTFLPLPAPTPGFVYFLIGVGMSINYGWHGRRIRAWRAGMAAQHEPGQMARE